MPGDKQAQKTYAEIVSASKRQYTKGIHPFAPHAPELDDIKNRHEDTLTSKERLELSSTHSHNGSGGHGGYMCTDMCAQMHDIHETASSSPQMSQGDDEEERLEAMSRVHDADGHSREKPKEKLCGSYSFAGCISKRCALRHQYSIEAAEAWYQARIKHREIIRQGLNPEAM